MSVDPIKCTVEGPGLEQKLLKSENQPSSQSALCGKMANSVVKSKVLLPGCMISHANESVLHANVSSKGRGIYEVTYTQGFVEGTSWIV